MATDIQYACLRFDDDKIKKYVKPISLIFKEKSAHHITPKDSDDYEHMKKYYVYWQSCSEQKCLPSSQCCTFYKAYILSLGGKSVSKISATFTMIL